MKSLVREIHRRSLWQVLGIYLAASWLVLQIVDVVGANFGLPEWVAPGALILLLIGLPIVLATAFVQEGMSTGGPEAPSPSLTDVGDVPPPSPSKLNPARGLFTWRRALLGGLAAFVLLAALTGVYLFLRAAGDRVLDALEGAPDPPFDSVFCDSLEVYGADWTAGFLEEFQKRRGWDLAPYLPALWHEDIAEDD